MTLFRSTVLLALLGLFAAVVAAQQPVSVPDGNDAALGTTTDPAVAAGDAGTISGKLRGMSDLLDNMQAILDTLDNAVSGSGFNISQIGGAAPTVERTFNGDSGAGTSTTAMSGIAVAAAGGAIAVPGSTRGLLVEAAPWVGGTLASGAVTTAMTATTSTSVIGATALNYIYVTNCTVSNASLTVSTDVVLQDGSGGTTLYNIPAPAAAVATTGGSGAAIAFPVPLKVPTAGNALYAANVTTGSSTKIACQGFKSTVSY